MLCVKPAQHRGIGSQGRMQSGQSIERQPFIFPRHRTIGKRFL